MTHVLFASNLHNTKSYYLWVSKLVIELLLELSNSQYFSIGTLNQELPLKQAGTCY